MASCAVVWKCREMPNGKDHREGGAPTRDFRRRPMNDDAADGGSNPSRATSPQAPRRVRTTYCVLLNMKML